MIKPVSEASFNSEYRSEIITTISGFEGLKEEWNSIADGLKNPLLRHEWYLCCAKTFHEDGWLRIFLIHRNRKLVAAAPFVAVCSRGVEYWEFLGASRLYEPCGLLYNTIDSLKELVRGLFRQGFPLTLQRLGGDSPVVKAFKEIPLTKGFSAVRTTSPSLSLRLPSNWSELLESRSRNFRYDLKRKFSRVNSDEFFSVEFHNPNANQLNELLHAVVNVEGSGWKGRRGSSMLHDSKLGQFFGEYSTLAAAEGILNIALLRIQEKVIAVQLGLVAYDRFWVLKMGHDESSSQFSPGFLLTAEAIRYAIQRKLTAYEFLGVAEPWEERWGPKPRIHKLMMVYPWTVRSVLKFFVDGLTIASRRILSRPK